jgi:hypothetical protein
MARKLLHISTLPNQTRNSCLFDFHKCVRKGSLLYGLSFFCKYFYLFVALINVFINFVEEINQTMRKTRYSEVVSQAEILASDPENYTRRGVLKSKVERQLRRMTVRIVVLAQEELVSNY